MDPNAARSKMVEAANSALALANQLEAATGADMAHECADIMIRLAEAVHDLDEWLRAGGFLPDVWVRNEHDRTSSGNQQPGRKQDVDV